MNMAGGRECPHGSYPKNRFESEGRTFYDRITGKRWLNMPDLVPRPLTWRQALDQISRINQVHVQGYGDWRLPNIKELESLVDINAHSPALVPDCPLDDMRKGIGRQPPVCLNPARHGGSTTQDGAIGVGFKPQQDFFLWAVR